MASSFLLLLWVAPSPRSVNVSVYGRPCLGATGERALLGALLENPFIAPERKTGVLFESLALLGPAGDIRARTLLS
jgi:hypothetical protein